MPGSQHRRYRPPAFNTGTLSNERRWSEGDERNSDVVPENLEARVYRASTRKPLVLDGMTMPEMALRLFLSNSAVRMMIPVMRKPAHTHLNIAASDRESELLEHLPAHRWDREPTEWLHQQAEAGAPVADAPALCFGTALS